MTRQLCYGQPNELKVKASTQNEKSSRWYTGGGLFRNVSMVATNRDLYLNRHPLYITTRQNRYVTVGVEMTFASQAKKAQLRLRITDPQGRVVSETTEPVSRLTPSRSQEVRIT